MKIYLNTNILCRPFDDLTQKRIRKEAAAINKIFVSAFGGLLTLTISDVALSEVELISDSEKKRKVYSLIRELPKELVKINEGLIKLADDFLAKKIIYDYMDVLHLVCANVYESNFYVTCDDELLQKHRLIERFFKESFRILNPVEFIKLMEEEL
ncbi:hypothetical protein KAU34_01900 [candidate division WOR-3 bacterium]|nr:hypothetical protein [candidate division WOR-3 bacterium]